MANCDQGCDRPAEVPMLVDYGDFLRPPVPETWCVECAAQQVIDEAEAWGDPASPNSEEADRGA